MRPRLQPWPIRVTHWANLVLLTVMAGSGLRILAYGMNGAPLPMEHGAPLRLYSAVKLGYKMVKYLTEVSFLPVRTGGYWEDQGYEWFGGL